MMFPKELLQHHCSLAQRDYGLILDNTSSHSDGGRIQQYHVVKLNQTSINHTFYRTKAKTIFHRTLCNWLMAARYCQINATRKISIKSMIRLDKLPPEPSSHHMNDSAKSHVPHAIIANKVYMLKSMSIRIFKQSQNFLSRNCRQHIKLNFIGKSFTFSY